MRVHVARHGETTWNMAGRYQGRRESGLSALGMRQGMALADAFDAPALRVGRIVSSPLLRCMATAQFTASRLDLELETDRRIIEIGHGSWEGRYREEIRANDGERMRMWKEDPENVAFIGEGGETLADVRERWLDFAAALQSDVPTLVCSHDAVVRMAILCGSDRPIADLWKVNVENAAYATFEVTGATWTLVRESSSDHLAGLHASIGGQAL